MRLSSKSRASTDRCTFAPTFAYFFGMGDVKLTPRQTARLLTYLEEGVRQLSQARAQLIEAMAERAVRRPAIRSKRAADARRPSR